MTEEAIRRSAGSMMIQMSEIQKGNRLTVEEKRVGCGYKPEEEQTNFVVTGTLE